MELSMKSRHEVISRVYRRYRKAAKAEKGKILDEFTQTTGYTRKYAAWVLSRWGKTVLIKASGKLLRFKLGARVHRPRPGRPPVYDAAFLAVLKKLWFLFDCLCGKRFVPMIRAVLATMAELGYLECDQSIREALARVSPATVDRLLAPERKRLMPRGRSMTRPGSLLKKQIPIRTFADWSDVSPGFVEADLVAHDGGSAYGDFLCTLTMTDIATGWTEVVAVLNKAQRNVFPGLQRARELLPFPLLGLDTDNGSEFINSHLLRYCEQERITFTRSRPYRKNDGCYVEQKNNSVVRRSVGYQRFDSPQALEALNALYERLRLLVNFVYPSAKLVSKSRSGSRVIRRYDHPMTPFQRILAHPAIADELKARLVDLHRSLDPVLLAREFRSLQDALLPLAAPVTNPFQQYKVFHRSTPSAPPSS
jgi:hypothetical protein